ncbi:MAG TPA: radical SAM protein [bacterium]|nr:radical SAM protein [bacterium]
MFIRYRKIEIAGPCNFNCRVCGYPKSITNIPTTEDILAAMEGIPQQSNVEFIGGEPFLRKDMNVIIKAASERFKRVKLTTNGSAFYYESKLWKALDAGLKNIEVKFFSVIPEIHNYITRTNTFEYAAKGIDNISRFLDKSPDLLYDYNWDNIFVAGRVIASTRSLPSLEDTVKHLSTKGFARIIIDLSHADSFSPSVIETVRGSIKAAIANSVWTLTVGLPLCLMSGIEEHCGEIYRLDKTIPGYAAVSGACDICVLADECAGVPAGFAGANNLKPITNLDHSGKLRDVVSLRNCARWNRDC